MNLVQLRKSRADWARKEGYYKRRHTAAVKAGSAKRIRKWGDHLRHARAMIARRDRQIAAALARYGGAGAVRAAARYVGVRETYRNGGGIINTWQRRLGFGNVAWCGIFCGNMMRAAGVRGVSSRIASVSLIEDDARRSRGPFIGWTTNEKSARAGDLAVIGGYGQHVAMVASVNADGSINTIEGNAGDAVRRLRRSSSQVRGIARVRY